MSLNRQKPSPKIWQAIFSIRRRNFVLHLLIIMIAFIMLGWNVWRLAVERADILDDAQVQTTSDARIAAENLYRVLSISDSALKLVAKQMESPEMSVMAAREFARDVVSSFPDLTPMLFINSDGRLVWNTGPLPGDNISYVDRDYFIAHRGGLVAGIGTPLVGRVSGKTYLPVTRRVADEKGGFRGVLFEGMEFAAIEEILKEATRRSADAAMIDREGRNLLQLPRLPEPRPPLRIDADFIQALMAEAVDSAKSYDRIAGSIVGVADVRDHPLAVAVSVNEYELLGGWRLHVFRVLGLNFLAIAGLIWWALRDARMIAALYQSNEDHQRDAAALRRSDERISLATTSAGVGFWELDLADDALRWDEVMCGHFGLPGTAFSGGLNDWLSRLSAEDASRVEQMLHEVQVTGKPCMTEHSVTHGDGERRFLKTSGVLRAGGDGSSPQVVGVTWDITDLVTANDRLESVNHTLQQLAFNDPLTGLPNRRVMFDRLEHAVQLSKRRDDRLAVIFIDLNKFKQLNDTHGHEVGDKLLVETGVRLTNAVRKTDTVARFGGDEFVVILENLGSDLEQASRYVESVAAKIDVALRVSYALDGVTHEGSASIGVYISDGREESAEAILRAADLAMYEEKKRSKLKLAR